MHNPDTETYSVWEGKRQNRPEKRRNDTIELCVNNMGQLKVRPLWYI